MTDTSRFTIPVASNSSPQVGPTPEDTTQNLRLPQMPAIASPQMDKARLPPQNLINEVPHQVPQRAEYVNELDRYEPIDPARFPNQPHDKSNVPPTTASNVAYILKVHDVSVRYNVIKKQIEILWNGQSAVSENLSSTSLNIVISLMVKNRMSPSLVPSMLEVIANQNPYSPAADWINSRQWDGIDRLQDFCSTLTERSDFSAELKKTLIHRWLISAVAAVLMENGFRCRGILTLQGPQSIGKTSWIRKLIDVPELQKDLIRIDHHLDAGNKDSKLTAISHWIVEIGELDSSLKKDVARLKGFITSDRDKIRRPYARGDSEYPRRTVFCASVNDHAFLVDQTGNSRFWTIPVTAIKYQHDVDMQQLFAQVAVDYKNGVPWWLTQEEEQLLEHHNKDHRTVSIIRERLIAAINTDPLPTQKETKPYTAGQALGQIGYERPSNQQCKEAATVLREMLGEPKKIQGNYKWRIPFRRFDSFGANWNQPTQDPDDLY